MSLRRLMWHHMSVFDRSSGATRDKSGGVVRIPKLIEINIPAHLQSMVRKDTVEKYAIKSEERMHRIFTTRINLSLNASVMLVFKNDPRQLITANEMEPGEEDSFLILEFKGYGEMVRHKKVQMAEIICQENKRWTFAN